MRDQYAGDVSDLLKVAFLRALAQTDRTLGIAWYYASHNDGKADGRHIEWGREPKWRTIDEDLYDRLSMLPERSLEALEKLAIWPSGTIFHRQPLPSSIRRAEWGEEKRTVLGAANLIFLDPDNGIGSDHKKHASFSEIRLLRQPKRAVVFISFSGKSKPHGVLVRSYMSGSSLRRMPVP